MICYEAEITKREYYVECRAEIEKPKENCMTLTLGLND